jgi:hypothetical protein
MRRTRMKKLPLLLSLLALGALGLVACGGGTNDDRATAAKVSANNTPERKLSRERAQEAQGEALAGAGAGAQAGGQHMGIALRWSRHLATTSGASRAA